MSDDDDNEQAVAFSFSETFDADAWNATVASQFESAGAKEFPFKEFNYALPGTFFSSNKVAFAQFLVYSVQDLMFAYARNAADRLPSAKYNKQILQIKKGIAESAALKSSVLGTSFPTAHKSFLDTLENLKSFIIKKGGSATGKFEAVFARYVNADEFQKLVIANFPGDVSFKTRVKEKVIEKLGAISTFKKGFNVALKPLVDSLVAIGGTEKQNEDNNAVNIHFALILGYIFLLNLNAAKTVQYFVKAAEQAEMTTKA